LLRSSNSTCHDHTIIRSHQHLTKSSTFSSLQSIIFKYFRRHRKEQQTDKSLSATHPSVSLHDAIASRELANDYRQTIYQKRRQSLATSVGTKLTTSPPNINHRLSRLTTTATFTGHKRYANEMIENKKRQLDNNSNLDDDQQLVRARLSTRTSSLPAARCVSYYYYQQPVPLQTVITKATIEDHSHHDSMNKTNTTHGYRIGRHNVSNDERVRSLSHVSTQCMGNDVIVTTDASGHSSSFDHVLDDEHHRLNHRAQPSHLSTSFNSSRYSQRAIAQFMHERHKARLRRNQKASRMLGICLVILTSHYDVFSYSFVCSVYFYRKTRLSIVDRNTQKPRDFI
jgi:hypothetical protein